MVIMSSMQNGYILNVGEISPETITAPWDIVDEVTTNSLIEEARAKTEPVYTINNETISKSLTALENDFESFDDVRAMAKQFYTDNKIAALQAEEDARCAALIAENPDITDEELARKTYTADDIEYSPASISWRDELTSDQMNSLYESLPAYVTDIELGEILRADNETLSRIENAAYSACLKQLSDGIKSEDLAHVANSIFNDLSGIFENFSTDYSFIKSSVKNNLMYNQEFNEEETLKAQEEAVASVDPVEYKQGQNIVVRGEIVTEAQYKVLEQSGLITKSMDLFVYLPAIFYMLFLFVLYLIYLSVFSKDIAHNTKKMIILAILTALAMLFCILSELLAPNVYMIFSIAILAAVLTDAKNAFVYSIFVSFILITASSDAAMFFTDAALRTVVISISGSFLAIIITNKTAVRAAALLAGLISAVPCAILYLIMILMDIITPSSFGLLMLWAVGGGLICGVVSIGLLPIFEVTFKIVTPAKLIELTDPRKRLLKRLMVEAPGTYHHSLAVGNLAENACEAIGADALLARAGAYYHDVGKLEAPEYFVENQSNDYNPHDFLPPEESARIITAHVADGRKMADIEKLPIEIKNIIFEHHGNTKVAYFLHKAKESSENVDESLFRYHANKPTTRESAIIMLADSVEAAMRAAGKSAEDNALAIIKKIISGKYDDGQLDFTPITLRDLDIISRIFADSYKGREHKRIEYPEEQEEKQND